MVKIYGIPNCDTTQKAIKWLVAKKINYLFHNYKESGIDKATLEIWLKYFPIDKLINTKSTTYRGLTEKEKAGITDKAKAIELMIKHNSLIKRPLWDLGDGKFFLGWDKAAMSQAIQNIISLKP
jgi:arsenate reductase